MSTGPSPNLYAKRFYRGLMELNTAKGKRICRLCEEDIKKGQKCFSISFQGVGYKRHIHIHKHHIKMQKPNKCSKRFECVLNKDYYCRTVICQNHKKEEIW